jgi:sugar lactone lactonase YvrE
MSSTRQRKCLIPAMVGFALLFWSGGRASADLTLTSAGVAQGFTLSTFASGFASTGASDQLDNFGPGGIAFPGSGIILVVDTPSGQVYRFSSDTDGQMASPDKVLGSYAGGPVGLVSFNGVTAMVLGQGNSLVALDPDTGNTSLIVSGLPAGQALDVVGNPLNGHYFVSTSTSSPGVVDVNPLTQTFQPFSNGADGLTISPDGKTLYGTLAFQERISLVTGYDTATGKQVYQTPNIPGGGADGSALGFGTLQGKLFVNTHEGYLIEIDMTTGVKTLLASGGSRGDLAKADPYNGSLLLTQSNSILRLTPPPGGSFAPVPEPVQVTGYSADVICDIDPMARFAQPFNGGTFAWFEAGAVDDSGAEHDDGLPAGLAFLSATGSGAVYEFQTANAANVLQLSAGQTGTLTLTTPAVYRTLYVLASSGDGSQTSMGSGTIHFADGGTQTFSYNCFDWNNGPYGQGGLHPEAALTGHTGRADVGSAGTAFAYNQDGDFQIYETILSIDPSHTGVAVTSIDFTGAPDAVYSNIFGVSGQ